MADPLWINASAGAPVLSANELRQAMSLALMYDGRNMGARQGVRPGGNQLFVSLAGSTITIQPGVASIDPGLSTPQGPYWVAIPVAETQTLQAADATNPRKDIVIARVYDHDEDASGLKLARTEYIAGVAAPSPAEPAVPAGAFRLATIDVPASPGAPVVTDRRPWTVAPGGVLPVDDSTQQSALAGYEGLPTYRKDTNGLYIHDGTTHQLVARKVVSAVGATEGTDQVGFTNTTYGPGSPVCGVAFTAPPSGIVIIFWHARFEHNDTSRVSISTAVRTGSTLGSGTMVSASGDGWALENPQGAGGNDTRIQAAMFRVVTGLTPDSTYNAIVEHRIQGGVSGDIFDRSIAVLPSA